jgi:hypothetical protein
VQRDSDTSLAKDQESHPATREDADHTFCRAPRPQAAFQSILPAFEGPDLPCSGSPRSRRMYLPLSGGGWVVAPSAGVCFWNPWPAESGNATRSDQVPLPVHPRVASSPCLQSRCSAGSRSFPCLRGGLNPRPTLCVVCRKAFDDSEPRLQCVNPGGQIPT